MIPFLHGASTLLDRHAETIPDRQVWTVRAHFRSGSVDERGCPEVEVRVREFPSEPLARHYAQDALDNGAHPVHIQAPRDEGAVDDTLAQVRANKVTETLLAEWRRGH